MTEVAIWGWHLPAKEAISIELAETLQPARDLAPAFATAHSEALKRLAQDHVIVRVRELTALAA
jgi:hypothetical protein